jgi:hypothetical protein
MVRCSRLPVLVVFAFLVTVVASGCALLPPPDDGGDATDATAPPASDALAVNAGASTGAVAGTEASGVGGGDPAARGDPAGTVTTDTAASASTDVPSSGTAGDRPSAAGSGAVPPAGTSRSGELAFIDGGDVVVTDVGTGATRRLTSARGVVSIGWSRDGSRLAFFDGRAVCVVAASGAREDPCIDVAVPPDAAGAAWDVAWAPDGRQIVLHGLSQLGEDSGVGWWFVDLDRATSTPLGDPAARGADLSGEGRPGGIPGDAAFLADGTLVGSFSHPYHCGSGGCSFALFRYDPSTRTFSTDLSSAGLDGLTVGTQLVVSADGRALGSTDSAHAGCADYSTVHDIAFLGEGRHATHTYDHESFAGQTLAPDAAAAVVSRTEGCGRDGAVTWSSQCGLLDTFEVYPMWLIDLATFEHRELPPGLDPAWSPDGRSIAFRSCLAQSPTGTWSSTTEGPPALYLVDVSGPAGTVSAVAEGSMPRWRPEGAR